MEVDPLVLAGTFLLGGLLMWIYCNKGLDKLKLLFERLQLYELVRQTGFESRSRSTVSGHEFLFSYGSTKALRGSTADSFFKVMEDYEYEAGTSGGAALVSTQSYDRDGKNGWGLFVLAFEERDPHFFLHWNEDSKCMLTLMQKELEEFVTWNLMGPQDFAMYGGLKVSWTDLSKVIKEILPKNPEGKDAVTVTGFPRAIMNRLEQYGQRINPTPRQAISEYTTSTLDSNDMHQILPKQTEDVEMNLNNIENLSKQTGNTEEQEE